MAGIGDQGHRIGPPAIGRLDDDESEVQDDPDSEGGTVIGRMMVAMMMAVCMGMGMRQIRFLEVPS